MDWKKGWVFFISFLTFLSPLSIEAKVSLSKMNRLDNVEIQSKEDKLLVKFYFKKPLVHLRQPVYFKKSIQVDFPLAYSQPAKQFLKTGDSQISQIYVSQFNSRTMRVRFILDRDEEGDFKKIFHMKKEGASLVVRVDREKSDILQQLLARTAKKFDEEKNNKKLNEGNLGIGGKRSIESRPILLETQQSISKKPEDLPKKIKTTTTKSDDFSKKVKSASIIPNDFPEKIKTATYNKKPKWKSAKGKTGDSSSSIKKTSFGLLQSEGNKESDSVSLVSSGLRMITTLSLVLGLIFLLFFGFKKYVLKNTPFGAGKLVQVLSTSFLAPKKNIALVEVAGEILVLGISDHNISLLTTIREHGRIEEIKNEHGGNAEGADSKQRIPGGTAGETSPASSNAARMFSKYLKQFTGPGSDKQASVDAVTEKIRRHMRKVKTT